MTGVYLKHGRSGDQTPRTMWLNPLMTLRNVSPVKEVLDGYGIPERHTVWASVAIGYPVADGVALAKRENVVRFV